MPTLKKGSAAAKAFMAKLRAAKGKSKVVKDKAKTKVGMNATANDIKVTSNVKNRTFTIKKNGTTYRTGKFSKPEFEELEYNTQNDWANFLRTQDNYSKVKTGAVKKVMPTKKASSMHKDTKSHNVNISVVSGLKKLSGVSPHKAKYFIEFIYQSIERTEYFDKLPPDRYKGMTGINYLLRLTDYGTTLIPLREAKTNLPVKK